MTIAQSQECLTSGRSNDAAQCPGALLDMTDAEPRSHWAHASLESFLHQISDLLYIGAEGGVDPGEFNSWNLILAGDLGGSFWRRFVLAVLFNELSQFLRICEIPDETAIQAGIGIFYQFNPSWGQSKTLVLR
jgi:hypothetical protein